MSKETSEMFKQNSHSHIGMTIGLFVLAVMFIFIFVTLLVTPCTTQPSETYKGTLVSVSYAPYGTTLVFEDGRVIRFDWQVEGLQLHKPYVVEIGCGYAPTKITGLF